MSEGWGDVFLKEVIFGWSAGCDEGAEVTDHKEWPQNRHYLLQPDKKQHSVNIPKLTRVPIQDPTRPFMVNGPMFQLLFLNPLEKQTCIL